MQRSIRLLALLILSGCPSLNPTSGTIRCGTDLTHPCPEGYVCFQKLCYKSGEVPVPIRDMGVTNSDASKPNGATCGSGTECSSGFCADSVCCATACIDACNACNVSGMVGTCSPVAAGAVPGKGYMTCGPDSMASCMRDGTCDGQGACHLWASTTVCKGPSCDPIAGTMTPSSMCDGSGVCVGVNPINCGPYKCNWDNSACFSKCDSSANCVPPASCQLDTQSCGPKPNGNVCGSGTECASGNCVDGTCCDKPQSMCNGCNACNIGPTVGKCSPVGAGNDPHAVCPYPCSGGCNGVGACASGSSMTVCAFSCQDTCDQVDSLHFTVENQCNVGNASVGACTNNPGMCGAPTTQSCPNNLTCASSTKCKTTCNKDADCLVGYWCSGTGGTCQAQLDPGSICTRSSQCKTLSAPGGDGYCNGRCLFCSSNADCFGNQCNGNGTACIGQCSTDADCTTVGAGNHCTTINGTYNICTCSTDNDCGNHRARGCFALKNNPSIKACTCNTSANNGTGGVCRYAYDCVNWGTNGYCLVHQGGVCTSNTDCASGLCQSDGTCF